MSLCDRLIYDFSRDWSQLRGLSKRDLKECPHVFTVYDPEGVIPTISVSGHDRDALIAMAAQIARPHIHAALWAEHALNTLMENHK